jgi:hypothetical protein
MQPAIDIQKEPDQRGIALLDVGIAEVAYPILVPGPAWQGWQPTNGEFTLSLDLPAEQKGTHMSRFMEMLADHDGVISPRTLPLLLASLQRRLGSSMARIEVEFKYFLPATTRDRLVPYTVFIDPQLGRVGLSEDEARRQGRTIRVAKMPMSHVARALEVDESRGFMKAVVDADSGQILGCAVLGIEGGELMAMLEIAMLGRLPYTALRDAVFAHPTLAESLNNLFATLDA